MTRGGWNLTFGIKDCEKEKNLSNFTLKYIESDVGLKQVTVGSLWKLTGNMKSINVTVTYKKMRITKRKFQSNVR